ncbi:hypothetical Protein YC6258_02796 [Gynuella sunshinyii YC6258]|uniref:Rhs family protein n=2 Tax=Gynuella sunshinyii TaxID=1445505 RepID=A0A0C5VWN0_9GAMM|nr:hypothetical Protein YC6258_02796 [Gynuella sunshinyii YC6258]
MATDASGQMVWSKDYDPYGNEGRVTGDGDTRELTFHHHQRIADAGLVYVGARWYSPRLRRFISPDPVGVPDAAVTGVNRFHYGLDNPLAYTDPDGEFVQFIVKFAVDVAIKSAIQYATTGEVDLKDAATSAAIGMFNPAKTLQRANKLMGITSKAIKSGECYKGNKESLSLY